MSSCARAAGMEATETFNRRNKESDLSDRDIIRTIFDYSDADEGRPVQEAKKLADGSGACSVPLSKIPGYF